MKARVTKCLSSSVASATVVLGRKTASAGSIMWPMAFSGYASLRIHWSRVSGGAAAMILWRRSLLNRSRTLWAMAELSDISISAIKSSECGASIFAASPGARATTVGRSARISARFAWSAIWFSCSGEFIAVRVSQRSAPWQGRGRARLCRAEILRSNGGSTESRPTKTCRTTHSAENDEPDGVGELLGHVGDDAAAEELGHRGPLGRADDEIIHSQGGREIEDR